MLDKWFNGDGNISAFRFSKGSVHLQQKYVRTEKFTREREAKRALAGKSWPHAMSLKDHIVHNLAAQGRIGTSTRMLSSSRSARLPTQTSYTLTRCCWLLRKTQLPGPWIPPRSIRLASGISTANFPVSPSLLTQSWIPLQRSWSASDTRPRAMGRRTYVTTTSAQVGSLRRLSGSCRPWWG